MVWTCTNLLSPSVLGFRRLSHANSLKVPPDILAGIKHRQLALSVRVFYPPLNFKDPINFNSSSRSCLYVTYRHDVLYTTSQGQRCRRDQHRHGLVESESNTASVIAIFRTRQIWTKLMPCADLQGRRSDVPGCHVLCSGEGPCLMERGRKQEKGELTTVDNERPPYQSVH